MKIAKPRDSYIIRFFRFLTQFFYHALSVGFIGRIFTSYRKSDQLYRTSYAGRALDRIERGGGRAYCAFRRGLALALERSLLRRGLIAFLRNFCLCSVRTIGLFFLTAGAYSMITASLLTFVWESSLSGAVQLYVGAVLFLLGAPLLFSSRSLGFQLRQSLIFRALLVPVLGLSEETLSDIPREGKHGYFLAVPIGMALGALSALLSPLSMIVSLIVFFVAVLVLATPEAGVLLTIAFLPFAGLLPNGAIFLAALVGVSMLSYLLKLLRGNRVLHFHIEDFVVLLLLVTTLCSAVSVAGKSAVRGALTAALMLSLYFMVVNTIATPRWLRRCRLTLVCSATLASIVGIVQFVLAAALSPSLSPSTWGAAVCVGFADRTTFAYYLLLAFPFALSAFVNGKHSQRLPAGLAAVSIAAAIVLGWVQSVWMAVLVMLVTFLLLQKPQAFPYVLVGSLVSPALLAMMPGRWRSGLFSVLRANSGVAFARNASAGRLASQIFFGSGPGIYSRANGFFHLLFGLGHGGFDQLCVLYTSLGAAASVKNVNFWLARLLEGGVLGVLLPGALFFLILQSSFSLMRDTEQGEHPTYPIAGVVLVVALLVHSIFRYAWYDPAAVAAFFLAIGLVSADGRYQRRRREARRYSEMTEDAQNAATLDY